MYCPLNDGHIVRKIHEFAQKTFEEKVENFRNEYGTIQLKGTNEFQKIICNLPVIDIQNSDILVFDKEIVDYENQHRLDEFWKKHQMELEKPTVPKSTDRKIYFAVVALMQLKAFWNKKHKAEKHEYVIPAKEVHIQRNLKIRGYRLNDVRIALGKNSNEISAYIDLGGDINIRLSDLTAFGDKKKLDIHNEKCLYELVVSTDIKYCYNGTLIAPCVGERMTVPDHLKSIGWESKDFLYQVNVESSKALTKLKLNEKGVEARAETIANVSMLIGCSLHNIPKTYRLIITHGLVVDIRYKNQPIFIAYIPQKNFQTV